MRSVSTDGLVADEEFDVTVVILIAEGLVDGVMSSKETEDETAEFAGVPKFFEARRTFQNYKSRMSYEGTQGSDAAHLGDHVAFRMPAFVSSIPVHLDKLFQNGGLASHAFDRESR